MTSLEKKYQKKTDKEHILDNPDTYIGSIENIEQQNYIYQNESIIEKNIMYNPGLFKLFDEGIVNCRDHYIRMKQQSSGEHVTQIHINIENNKITMYNNGNGIDVEKHPTHNVWIPELIFGHLRTSTNYNKEEKKITGGKNGFGFKLVLIWSTYGKIETLDKGSTVLGMFQKLPSLIVTQIKISSGFNLFCYTDGLTETQNDLGEFYGSKKIKELFKNKKSSPDKIIDLVLEDLKKFKGNNLTEDDITLLMAKIRND